MPVDDDGASWSVFCYGETERACSGASISGVDVFQNVSNRIFKQSVDYIGTELIVVVMNSSDDLQGGANNGPTSDFFTA